jgi:hypothetical protein
VLPVGFLFKPPPPDLRDFFEVGFALKEFTMESKKSSLIPPRPPAPPGLPPEPPVLEEDCFLDFEVSFLAVTVPVSHVGILFMPLVSDDFTDFRIIVDMIVIVKSIHMLHVWVIINFRTNKIMKSIYYLMFQKTCKDEIFFAFLISSFSSSSPRRFPFQERERERERDMVNIKLGE